MLSVMDHTGQYIFLGRFTQEILCIYMKENSSLIISGYHLMVHLKVMILMFF